jgi:excisionase family DNA binding protein
MESIARFLRVPVEDVFPYYGYITLTEAAAELNVSTSMVSKRIKAGKIPFQDFGTTKMVKKSDIERLKVTSRKKKSIKATVSEFLEHRNGSGATVDEFLSLFEPFPTEDDMKTKKKSIQSVLSRSFEFEVDKNCAPPRWRLVKKAENDGIS